MQAAVVSVLLVHVDLEVMTPPVRVAATAAPDNQKICEIRK
jgi:hypothetical protein